MNNYICVFLQDDDKLDSFLKSSKIVVFNKSDAWERVKTIILPDKYSQSPSELRKQMTSIIGQLGDSKIIAGLELTGIPYRVFDSFEFSIFSISELNDEVLDGIISDIKNANIKEYMKNEIINNAKPVKTQVPGVYSLDLITLQTECPEISSKKALKDFFCNTPFIELQLLCNHIPPWLENGDYDITSYKDKGEKIMAIIRKKLCKEGL